MSKYPKEELMKRLTPLQYQVTQQNCTEPPYKNEYYKCQKQGEYNCIVCNKLLFTSDLKFDSGCGWPAFSNEAKQANILKKRDEKGRTEMRCSECDSHLGHIYKWTKNQTGMRYCINSASIKLQEKK